MDWQDRPQDWKWWVHWAIEFILTLPFLLVMLVILLVIVIEEVLFGPKPVRF